MKSQHLLIAAVATAGALAAGMPAVATSQTSKHVVLSNVPAVPNQAQVDGKAAIPLTGTVHVDPAGNIVVTCDEQGQGKCSNVGTGGDITGTPTLSLNGPGINVAAAGAALTWSTSNAQVCYGLSATLAPGSTGPAVTGWSKEWPATGSYSLNALLGSVTPGETVAYDFTLRCYSTQNAIDDADAVAFVDSTRRVTLAPPAGGSVGSGSCDAYLGSMTQAERDHFDAYRAENRKNSANQSYNFTRIEKTFTAQTGKTLGKDTGKIGPAAYPYLPGVLGDTQYLALSFAMPAQNETNTGWFAMDQRSAIGVGKEHNVVMTISPCPGDFRPRNNASNDVYLKAFCRSTHSQQFVLKGGSNPSVTDGCPTPAGQTMYLNISLRDLSRPVGQDIPADGCATGLYCGISTTLSN